MKKRLNRRYIHKNNIIPINNYIYHKDSNYYSKFSNYYNYIYYKLEKSYSIQTFNGFYKICNLSFEQYYKIINIINLIEYDISNYLIDKLNSLMNNLLELIDNSHTYEIRINKLLENIKLNGIKIDNYE